MTGAGLRATGVDFDLRKARPYMGYENYDFEVPVGYNGDAYDRCMVKVEEMRQSLRIIRQCMDNMPQGPYKADHPLAVPPPKDRTLNDIETLINHFISVLGCDASGRVYDNCRSDQRFEQLLHHLR